jgi:hypothetical protein
MEPRDALLLLSWTAITFLALGMVGLARAVNMLNGRLAESVVGPRRLTPGDKVQLPSEVRASLTHDAVIVLFVTAACRSCLHAVEALQEYGQSRSDLDLLVLWRDERPDEYPAVGLVGQASVFEELKVSYTPFACLVVGSQLELASAVASSSLLDRFRNAATMHLNQALSTQPATTGGRRHVH